ncbi:MAG TPA: hypothetical protein VG819_04895 [Rhizomicrobium sp.]|nr:hypothetical protein [Rhizomicrobium sp.]
MWKPVALAAAAGMALLLAAAAYTRPSRAELHAAAVALADRETFAGSVASHVTGLLGNDVFDDYIFFDRYRVYVGTRPRVECYGAFARTSCTLAKPADQNDD